MAESLEFPNGHNCRHEKTVGALPPGAPLPDVDIPENDDIMANQAYETAKEYLSKHGQIEATEYFERAVSAFRRTKGHYSKKLAKKIVLDYGKLLRAHQGTEKANELEKEFLSKPSEQVRNGGGDIRSPKPLI
jgi:hypothetical protein